MRISILCIALYFVLSFSIYGQEIPTLMQPELLVGKDLYKNNRLDKNVFMEDTTAGLSDSIEFISSILWTKMRNVVVRNNYAYCIFANGLVILDISDKSKLVKISQLFLVKNGGSGNDIFLNGNYAYVANGSSGLQIINISNPESPVLASSYDTPGDAKGVMVIGNYAYVADGSSLKIVNVSNPALPVLTGSYKESYYTYNRVMVSGNYAYLSGGNVSPSIINISNPASPVKAGFIYTGFDDVMVNGNYAYVASGYDLMIFNVGNPASPVLVNTSNTSGYINRVKVSGNYVYVTDGYEGLQIFNVSNPASPVLAGIYETQGRNPKGLMISDNYAYVADEDNGLQIINVSNPASPVLAGSYDAKGSVYGVMVSGNYAYVADGNNGLQIINVSNPASPVLAGSYDTQGDAYEVMVSGNYAYVVGSYKGLQIIDVSNPASPVSVASYDVQGNAGGVMVSGNYAYVTVSNRGLFIINVSNPALPVLVGRYQTPWETAGVMVSGNYAYVADRSYGLYILNISNPSIPVLTGRYENSKWDLSKVMVNGNYAYISAESKGLGIVDVSNPAKPILMGRYDTPGGAQGVIVCGNYAYVADGDSGLQIINVSNPASPVLAGRYQTPGRAQGIMVSGGYVYVADDNSLMILRYGTTNTSPLASCTISPTAGTTSTIFQFDASGSSDDQDPVLILQVRWDWENDGTWDTNYSTTKTIMHQYASAGIYTAKLEIKDTGGLTTTITKPCTVRVPSGHFRVAYNTTGYNSTVLVQTTSTITVNNNPFTLSTGDEIAIYTPSPDTMCCGVGTWDGRNMAITVWGDNDQTTSLKEGFTAGQIYTFHLWDASELRENRFGEATFSSGSSTYSVNGMSIVDTLNFSTVIRLPINLSSGWNMISSNVIPQFPRMDSVFQDIVSKVVIVKNISGKVYWPRYNINQIGIWNIVEGYQIYMSNAATLTMQGQRVNPSMPISLSAGWSIIAYLPNVSSSPVAALASLGDKVVIMKDVSGKVFWPRYSIDQIGTMQVGKGYQIYLSSADTLIYPASASKEGNILIVESRNRGQLSPQHFSFIRGTGSNATILVRMNEKPVINGAAVEVGDEIGVYTPEGICAGAGVWNGDDVVITVWGDNGETTTLDGFTDGRTYTFKLWDKSTNVENDISVIAESGNLMYSENGITIISYEKNSALPENFVLRQNYPNPFNPSTRIEYQIKSQSEVILAIYNTAGQLIRMLVQSSQLAGAYSVEWDGKNSSGIQVPSGIYLYRLQAGSLVETRKMILMK